MAFVFDSTVGGTSTNSFVSVSEADDYFESHLEGNFWEINTSRKQAALAMATRRINRESFGGQKTTRESALQWPRTNVISREKVGMIGMVNTFEFTSITFIDPNIIPTELKEATFEQALHYLKVAEGEFTADENDMETLESMKVGPLDLKFRNRKSDRLPTRVKELLEAIGPNAWQGSAGIRFTA